MRLAWIFICAHLALAQSWQDLKARLQDKYGAEFFESNLKNSVRILTGTVVSSRPPEFVLAVSDRTHPEVVLIDRQAAESFAPGAKITFAGVAKAFAKDPFLLTFEVGSGGTFAVFATSEPSTTMPRVSITYPSRLNDKFASLSLEGFEQREFDVNGTEMTGIRFDAFLSFAGWHGQRRYSVEFQGVGSNATLNLSSTPSFSQQAWLVPGKNEVNMVFVRPDGTLISKVDAIQRIVVSPLPLQTTP